jgi:hypothetical protein
MRWTLWTLAGLGAIAAVVAIIGWMLPQSHEASRSARFQQPRERLFAAVQQQVEDEQKTSDVRMELAETQSTSRLVMRVAPGQAFGGTWTFEFVPDADGTRLTITERGEVYNPVFRFMSRFVFGHTATMDAFIEKLGKRLGETPS